MKFGNPGNVESGCDSVFILFFSIFIVILWFVNFVCDFVFVQRKKKSFNFEFNLRKEKKIIFRLIVNGNGYRTYGPAKSTRKSRSVDCQWYEFKILIDLGRTSLNVRALPRLIAELRYHWRATTRTCTYRFRWQSTGNDCVDVLEQKVSMKSQFNYSRFSF